MAPMVIIGIFMALALLMVIAGVVLMATGGKVNQKFSNKLMVMRVVFQALAVFTLVLFFSTN